MSKWDFIAREKEMAARNYEGRELEYLRQVLTSGKLSSLAGGELTPKFEKEFARMVGTRYAVAMNCCMSALHTAVMCAEAEAGTEVICDPEYIFAAQAILYNNAIPVFVDINPVTHNMNPERIEPAITERTRAIIVTHAWGLPAEMDRIVEIAHRHNLLVIEDCAEAIAATYKGKYVGNWGDVGCFSFQASKQMSLGDGGMATTSSKQLAEKLAQNAGAPTSGSVSYGLHYGYRMTETTAAVGLAQLETLSENIKKLKTNAQYYDEAVAGCKWLRLQRGPDEAVHTFYHWAATFEGEEYGITLADFRSAVEKADISSVAGYTDMPAYRHPLIKGKLAHAFHCPTYKGNKDNYPVGLCPVAEKVIPRIVIAYMVEPEEIAKKEAEKLRQVIRELERE
jgi:dTDP-4-amino-4,6-dideoxygalactose transaminase